MPIRKANSITAELRNRHFLLFDLIVVMVSPVFALFLRLEGTIPNTIFGIDLLILTLLLAVIKISTFYFVGMYNRLWKSASIDELARIITAGIIVLLIETPIIYISRILEFGITGQFPLSLPALDSIITLSFVALSRFSIRLIETLNNRVESEKAKSSIIILGAGGTGLIVLNEMLLHPSVGRVVGFLDDDTNKHHLRIKGVPVFGSTTDLQFYIEKLRIKKVIISMATASGAKIKSIHEMCKGHDVELLTIPSMYSIVSNKINFSSIKKVKMEDLLRREPIETNIDHLKELIEDKIIFISGAGGSIGSEIVRQVMKFRPKKLLIFGKGENSIFEIQQEILGAVNSADKVLVPLIGDIRNERRLDAIFNEFNPSLVFHAAAHKHVPLMEANVEEAITNNVMGTQNLVKASSKYGVKKFILISTDKAVNPTSIMGVTKRLAEMVVLREAKNTGLSYSAVRFGNVLGSRGSVVKTFERQIANGGPISVTHKDIKRYFMTIPEAVQLVLQASILNKGGEVFVLDMGEPVKIVDLAKDMIYYSGLKYKEDIDIVVTGLRPGEKLFEELFLDSEEFGKTCHKLIYTSSNAVDRIHPLFEVLIPQLIESAIENNGRMNDCVDIIRELVPEFKRTPIKKVYIN